MKRPALFWVLFGWWENWAREGLAPDYLEHMAEFALKTWKAVQAASPGVVVPEEVAEWEKAVRDAKG